MKETVFLGLNFAIKSYKVNSSKSLYLFVALILCCKTISSQQSGTILDVSIDLLQNYNVIYNQKMINPTALNDSNNYNFDLGLYKQYSGQSTYTEKVLYISAETNYSKIHSSFGINCDYKSQQLLKQNSFITSYKYYIVLGKFSRIEAGINFGLLQFKYKYMDFLEETWTEWLYIPAMDLGLGFKYKNQCVRISYNNLFQAQILYAYEVNNLITSGLIATYSGKYKILKKLSLIPEVYTCFNSDNIYGIFVAKVDYGNILSGGLLYNTQGTFGGFFSGVIKKLVKIGGYFYQDPDMAEYSYGMIGLNVGVIINHKRK